MNDIFDFIDKLSIKADSRATALAKVIESQLITLKWKVSKCSQNCFLQQTTLQAALRCENECRSSVEKVSHFIQGRSETAMTEFNTCLKRLEGVMEGNDEFTSLHQGVSGCYRGLLEAMGEMEKSILEEFSYYE
mmetsp:Transcript_29926/g.53131  ORF Transcript_29926/g.53131 Transcript_29926/m.53131 type:complete len:134 (-) Transcript_29926:2038-2439(-)